MAEEKIKPNDQEVDEYTQKMDRMVQGFQKQSKETHQHDDKVRKTMIWVGILVILACIFLMFNSGISDWGFSILNH